MQLFNEMKNIYLAFAHHFFVLCYSIVKDRRWCMKMKYFTRYARENVTEYGFVPVLRLYLLDDSCAQLRKLKWIKKSNVERRKI